MLPSAAISTMDGASTQFPTSGIPSPKYSPSPDFHSTFTELETFPRKPICVLGKELPRKAQLLLRGNDHEARDLMRAFWSCLLYRPRVNSWLCYSLSWKRSEGTSRTIFLFDSWEFQHRKLKWLPRVTQLPCERAATETQVSRTLIHCAFFHTSPSPHRSLENDVRPREWVPCPLSLLATPKSGYTSFAGRPEELFPDLHFSPPPIKTKTKEREEETLFLKDLGNIFGGILIISWNFGKCKFPCFWEVLTNV